MNGFDNECKDRVIKKYYDKMCERLDIEKWLRLISHEVHLLGDCFPFIEIGCEHCSGSGKIGDQLCEHEGGTVRRIVILNPDYVDVYTSPINPVPVIALKPDEELINMVQKKTPGFERLTPEVRTLVSSGKPIPLDNRNIFHIKYGEGGYTRYGVGMVRRLFPILSYKTKLMVAQWIVAERLIVPIRVVKVGSDERPAGPADIAAVQQQLAQTANDPNLTIVTHNAFEIDFIGACHDDQTEVLTKDGWKKFKDATSEDIIGTYNLNNGKLEYQKPIEKQEYNYNGKMFKFTGKHVDICVTPNHMMLASKMKYKNEDPDGYKDWGKIRADEVSHNDRFVNQIAWDGEIPAELPYKNTMLGHMDLDIYLEFLGYYLSEGGIKISEGSPDAIHLTQKVNSEYYERMKQLMILVKDNVKISQVISPMTRDNIPIAQIIINSRKLAKEMMSIYGHKSYGKFIPKWILNLPCDKLRILFETMINGDGSRRQSQSGKLRLRYNTVSKQLSEDVFEIGMKLGYSVSVKKEPHPEYRNYNTHDIYRIHFSLGNEEKYRTIRKKNIKQIDYNGKVYCFTVSNGYIITRRNGRIGIHGNSGKVLTLSNEFEFINQEILDGMMINNALLNGEGPTFSNAAVGIEAMIERLQTFRREISNWIEQKIYLPEAKRQGFIDKDADSEEEEYIYPKIKWHSMHLRDQQQHRTFVLQLYEKGLLSAQTVLETFDFDPDQEIERKRYDAVQMMALGQGMGEMGMGQPGGAGGAGGAPGGEMGGGFGGMPPMPGGGGEAGGGLPGLGGDAGGGAPPISAPGGGGAPAMSTSKTSFAANTTDVADPSNYGGKVLKERTRQRVDMHKQKMFKQREMATEKSADGKDIDPWDMPGMRDAKGRIVFTKPERELMERLSQYRKNGLIQYPIMPQHVVAFGSTEYPIDFAIPHLKLGIEADGEIFHSSPKQLTHDKERDMKLAQAGWTILRFKDSEIDKQLERVMSTIMKSIMQKESLIQSQKIEPK
jgi:very-short-patch-repair endonuclease